MYKDDYAGDLPWHRAQDLGIRGLAWANEARGEPFDRLPAHMLAQTDEKMHDLATQPSGVHIDFAGAPEHSMCVGPCPTSGAKIRK